MIKDETQEVDLETSTEEAEEGTDTDTEEEQGVDYWKAEALKNKAILDRNKSKKEESPKEESKSDEFGYKAYLKSSGIKSDEFDFVKTELKKAGGDIDSLLENEYFIAKLEKHRKIKVTEEATPKGKRTGNVATDSVDYWMGKDFKDIPTLEMRSKVIEARERKDSGGVFYNS